MPQVLGVKTIENHSETRKKSIFPADLFRQNTTYPRNLIGKNSIVPRNSVRLRTFSILQSHVFVVLPSISCGKSKILAHSAADRRVFVIICLSYPALDLASLSIESHCLGVDPCN